MILYAAHGTSNLGDFFNSLPVLSGISKTYGKYILVIQNDMERFNGIIELLKFQDIFLDVVFEKDFNNITRDIVVPFNSWVREEQTSPIRPVETCRYEIRFKEDYQMVFDVDDNFILELPKIETVEFDVIIGDRCSNTSNDKRRSCDLIKTYNYKGHYLDYTNPISYNLNLINKSHKFITTLTGISVLVDLMNKPQIVLYDKMMETWDNRSSIQDTFDKHYYKNRKTVMEKIC